MSDTPVRGAAPQRRAGGPRLATEGRDGCPRATTEPSRRRPRSSCPASKEGNRAMAARPPDQLPLAGNQRYQRLRRVPPSPTRTRKPTSQITRTASAIHHRTCTAKPSPPRMRASRRTIKMIAMSRFLLSRWPPETALHYPAMGDSHLCGRCGFPGGGTGRALRTAARRGRPSRRWSRTEHYPADGEIRQVGEPAVLDDLVRPAGVGEPHDRREADGRRPGVDPCRRGGELAYGHGAHDEPEQLQLAGVERPLIQLDATPAPRDQDHPAPRIHQIRGPAQVGAPGG